MRVTANQIECWAKTRQSQEELPLLIRKLISATNKLSELSMPGGDSIYRPGWDGKVTSSNTSAWVPEGKSVWEMGCNSGITTKANSDFNKRTKEFSEEFRQSNSFIFVTPYRWHKKENWLEEKRVISNWKNINVIDADDLEIWFENAPAVALEFSELIGLSGEGVESVKHYWQNWSEQSTPHISVNAIQLDREQAKKILIDKIENKSKLLVIEADSREEAAAFCSSVIFNHSLNKKAVCISSERGWKFVEANPELRAVILTSSNIASKNSPKEGLTIIQPICHGDDINAQFNDSDKISISRISPDSFKKALLDLGEEESDARRLTSSSGRSWSVYRRLKAINPIIRQPTWLNGVNFDNLIVLLLVGAWSSSSKGDIALIEALMGKSYEKLEDELSELVMSDDSPVINIRNVWKAKSPIELLYLVAPRLSKSKLKRFLDLVNVILSKPDPMLKLPESDRWMANIYGKVREESGVVIESILNSLIKLKLFSETTDLNISSDINDGVNNLINGILSDADEDTWMSLSSYLPDLAEASPDIFLTCLEKNLSKDSQPVTKLIKYTTSSGFGNQCWYSGLLWSLETIAWNPSKLHRVTNILIELNKVPNDSNWGNKPSSTLYSFYRVHSPQVLATPEQKIKILNQVIKYNEDFAWEFIFSLIPIGGSVGLNNSRPKWRDDDAGSEYERSVYYPHYLSWIGETVLDLAKGKAGRIAKLIDKYSCFSGGFKQQLLLMIEGVGSFDDVEKEIILNRLRKYISYYQTDDIDDSEEELDRLKRAYFSTQPNDLILRYKWLFQSRWLDLPEGERRDNGQTEALRHTYRSDAIKHIWDELGTSGIERLLSHVEDAWLVGNYVAKYQFMENLKGLMNIAFSFFINSNYKYQEQFLSGVIGHIAEYNLQVLLKILPEFFNEYSFNSVQRVAVLACLPNNKDVFNFVDSLDEETKSFFWRKAMFNYINDDDLFEIVLAKLVSFNRYNSIFNLIQYDFKRVESKFVFEVLNSLLKVEEEGTSFPDGYKIRKAIEFISESNDFNQRELASIEFAYLPVFHDPKYVPTNLLKELLSSPQAFIELVCYAFKSKDNNAVEDNFKSSEHVAKSAWQVLHYGRGTPGIQSDGTINATIFHQWVNEVRELGKKYGRLAVTDLIIGGWLSECPVQEDGVWPCYPVCELLEQSDVEDIRESFSTGIRNNRGVITKVHREGGRQEWILADKYKSFSDKLQNMFPQTVNLLNNVASYYEHSARAEDDDAKLSDEFD